MVTFSIYGFLCLCQLNWRLRGFHVCGSPDPIRIFSSPVNLVHIWSAIHECSFGGVHPAVYPQTSRTILYSNLVVKEANGDTSGNDSMIGRDLMLQFSVNYDVTLGNAANLYSAGVSGNEYGFPLGETFSVSGSGTYTKDMPAQPGYYYWFTMGEGSNTLINSAHDPIIWEAVYIRTEPPFVSGNELVFPPDAVLGQPYRHLWKQWPI